MMMVLNPQQHFVRSIHALLGCLLFLYLTPVSAWMTTKTTAAALDNTSTQAKEFFLTMATTKRRSPALRDSRVADGQNNAFPDDGPLSFLPMKRREMLLAMTTTTTILGVWPGFPLSSSSMASAEDDLTDLQADAEASSFADIAARASQISKDLDKQAMQAAKLTRATNQTLYDFEFPVRGKQVQFQDLIQQEFREDSVRVKAIVMVNIKQDDPVARRIIPELINLAARFGRDDGSLAIVVSPTDQGYYEPDTSQLIRLKLESEYGYGINPATGVTDKLNLLGSKAHPGWRWLQSTARTPSGLGRVEGNFEKFLVDGRTGLPVRRYPRRYSPLNMADDIQALISGKPLPPPRANWAEEWRMAASEAERDTYRFEKGLNYFDQ